MTTSSSVHTHYIQEPEDIFQDETESSSQLPATCCSFLKRWWNDSIWPGMGLFGESYLLFSIGTLTPLWKAVYPNCFADYDDTNDDFSNDDDVNGAQTCSPQLIRSLTTGVVMGIILGMVLLGYASDTIGRRNGSILTAGFMSVGSVGLVGIAFLANNMLASTIFKATVASLVLFGIGVGGEYPLSASLASERALEELKRRRLLDERFGEKNEQWKRREDERVKPLKSHRGRRVQLVFAMQGMGIWFNSLTMLVLFLLFQRDPRVRDEDDDDNSNRSNDNYDRQDLIVIWRTTYGIGAVILCFVFITRILFLSESKIWLDAQTTPVPNDPMGSFQITDSKSQTKRRMKLVHQRYGSRMFGAGMSWLLWDISFYGNKLFQSTFLLALVGETASLARISGASLLNASVALLGYYGAAFVIDLPNMRRTSLQSSGLLANGILFCACGWLTANNNDESSNTMVVLYMLSSFVGQLGPNCTTFLLPAEIVPTEQRTYCHGICAAAGKVGALIASVVFHFVPTKEHLFYLSGATSVLAALTTVWFIPETSNLDVLELDIYWKSLWLHGNDDLYEGPANHPDHLSMYEKIRWREMRGHEGVASKL